MTFDYPEGATPLNADEVHNLIPRHLTTQHELNEWEQFNIVQAEQWLFRRKQKDIYLLKFAQKLHHKMFDQTWKWAGELRKTQTNIGVHRYRTGIKKAVWRCFVIGMITTCIPYERSL